MKLLFIILLFASSLWAQPVCSGPVTVDDITATGFRVKITADVDISYARVQYGIMSTSEFTQGVEENRTVSAGGAIVQTVTGLTAATEYMIAVSASANGSTWCTALTANVTTAAAATSYEPAPPVISWDPHTRTPRTGITYNIGCDALHTNLTTRNFGDTIALTAGATCDTDNATDFPDGIMHAGVDGTRWGWSTGWTFNTTTDRGTKTSHGFSDGQTIIMAGQYNSDQPPAPLHLGKIYYIKLIDANTVEFALTAGGATIDLTEIRGTTWLSEWPFNCTNELVITTQGAATNFPPEGVRTGPEWATRTNWATLRGHIPLTGGFDPSRRAFALNWGALRCVRFENIAFAPKATVNDGDPDPPINGTFFEGTPASSHVVLDRVYVKAPNLYPYRWSNFANSFDGRYMAIINSYFENIGIWQPTHDHALTFSGNSITIGAGTHRIGKLPSCTSTASLTGIGGGTTGTIYTERDGSCNIYVIAPTGTTGTCNSCTLSTSGSPDWSNADGAYTRFPISSAAISSGTVSSHNNVNNAGMPTSKRLGQAEGTAGVISASTGEGPYVFTNNSCINCLGIPFYVGNGDNETASRTAVPYDVQANRNLFRIDDQYIASQASYNGRARFGHRNFFECKSCVRLQANGNIFSGNLKSNNNGPAIVLTPLTSNPGLHSQNTITDAEIGYNTIERSAVGVLLTGRYPGPQYVAKPTRRVKIHNNIFSVDGRYTDTTAGEGTAVQLFHGPTGVKIENNTFVEQRGSAYSLFISALCHPLSALTIRDNILFLNTDSSSPGIRYSNCSATANFPNYGGQTAKQALDNVAPSYSWRSNAAICGYSNVSTPTEITQAGCDAIHDDANDFRDLAGASFWAAGETLAVRRSATKFHDFTNGNYRLRYDSPFRGASYANGQAGVDIEALKVAQGAVTGVSARLTAPTTLDLAWTAPDSFRCYGEVLTNTGTLVTRTQAAQTTRRQSVQFTGLTAATAYQWRVLCAAEQPSGRFMTR